MYLLMSPFTALKAIETSVRTPTYRGIGFKIRVPVFWISFRDCKPMLNNVKHWLLFMLIL